MKVISLLILMLLVFSSIQCKRELTRLESFCQQSAENRKIILRSAKCYVKVSPTTYISIEEFINKRDGRILQY